MDIENLPSGLNRYYVCPVLQIENGSYQQTETKIFAAIFLQLIDFDLASLLRSLASHSQ